MKSIYEETLEQVVESCRNEDGSFDWEEYQRFCNSGENNCWYDED